MDTNLKGLYKSVYEMIHEWANDLLRSSHEYSMGDYWCTKDDFYLGSLHVATKINGYTFVRPFDRTGAFNSGYNSNNIISAIPYDRKNKAFRVSNLPSAETFKNRNQFIDWFKVEYTYNISNNVHSISNIKDFINNNRRSSNYLEFEHIYFNNFYFCPDVYLNRYSKTINNIRIKARGSFAKYHGWSSSPSGYGPEIVIDHTIKQLISDKWRNLFFSDEELSRYEVKIKQIKSNREDREANAKRNKVIDYVRYLEEWKTTPYAGRHYGAPYESVKIDHFDSNKVITTMLVRVSLEEARRAYKVFKLYYDNNTQYVSNGDVHKVDNFRIIAIKPRQIAMLENGLVVVKEVWCMVVGCHTIPYFEIEDFVKRNNLDW